LVGSPHPYEIMVVLSAAVTTKNGRALFARQFVEMNRLRIEGLLAAFPKLMGSGNKQHTFVETDSVRYVYQPVENIFLLLITNKASNIVEDLETLRLLSKVVPDIAGGYTEEKISDKAFELIFAFDEVITTGGYREAIDLRTIKANLEMDSHEEKLHNMVKKTKMDTAKDQAKHMSQVIKQRQRETAKTGLAAGGMAGMGGGVAEEEDLYGDAGYPNGSPGGPSAFPEMDAYSASPPPPEPEPIIEVKSMKLGSKKKGKTDLMSKMAAEDGLDARAFAPTPKAAAADALPPPPPPTAAHPIALAVEERLTIALSQEGALEAFDLKGTLSLTANDEAASCCKVVVAHKDAAAGTTFATHPKVDKKTWEADGVVVMKGSGKGFPVGRPVGVVRWALSTTDERQVPLTINCWPEDEGDGQMNVNIEYATAREMELYDVSIKIPGCASAPEIVEIAGTHAHDAREETLDWRIDCIDASNTAGTLEFNIAQRDADAFFPIVVSFRSKSLYYDVPIESVVSVEHGSAISYSLNKALSIDEYKIA